MSILVDFKSRKKIAFQIAIQGKYFYKPRHIKSEKIKEFLVKFRMTFEFSKDSLSFK